MNTRDIFTNVGCLSNIFEYATEEQLKEIKGKESKEESEILTVPLNSPLNSPLTSISIPDIDPDILELELIDLHDLFKIK